MRTIFLSTILLLLGFSSCSVIPECMISGWSDWGVCSSDTQCKKPAVESRSFKLASHGPGFDRGRAMMERGIAMKKKAWAEQAACLKAGTCPEARPGDSIVGQAVPCVNNEAAGYPCNKVDLLSFLNLVDLTCGTLQPAQGNDMWGWVDPQTGDEYVIMGLDTGTSFVKVTDPVNPVILGYLDGVGSPSSWRDFAVVNDHVYIVSEEITHGMQVFDLNRLRELSGDCNANLEMDVHYTEIGNSHNIVGHQGSQYVYIVGATNGLFPNNCNGGLHIIDVRNPKQPTFVGCWDFDGYTHDADCIIYNGPDTEHVGKEICFCYNEDSLTIVDVTNKENLNSDQELSRTAYSNVMYTHQGTVSPDHTVVLLDDEFDEMFLGLGTTYTYVWDVSDLDNPILRNEFVSTETAVDHNQYIRDNLAFQSNYEAGLRILHLDAPNFELEELAYFDCRPDRTTLTFEGAWSNYPYFPSGVVGLSSINYGLYLLQPRYGELNAQIKVNMNAKMNGEQSRTATVINSKSCPVITETRMCKTPSC